MFACTFHRCATMQQAQRAGKVIDGVVQCKAVIPEDEVAFCPARPECQLGSGYLLVEVADEGRALFFGHANKTFDEHPIHINSARASHRVFANDRMLRNFPRMVWLAGPVITMYRSQPTEHRLKCRAQGFVRSDATLEASVAAHSWQNLGMQR